MTTVNNYYTFICTLILLISLASAVLIVGYFRKRHSVAAFISVSAAFAIMLLSLIFLFNWDGYDFQSTMPWLTLGNFKLSMGYYFNSQTALMLAVVSVIGFFIHLFSLGYMKEDKSKARFFAGLSIFMFSMLGIILADNLIMIFIFWELVGFSSYALIIHYADTDYASMASKKAFIVNRVGDFGFLIGIVACYWHYGTVDLVELQMITHFNLQSLSTMIALLLICGFIGKSAQFPLHVWLPDAMAGPTPVSALIHAATMVVAGIYLLARIIFLLPAEVLCLIAALGSFMAVFAGLCALGQRDIKKILAYSTLSQLGYMAVAVGLNYRGLGLFHVATHACFKALLFLAAGSIIHSLHHEQDIFNMGGLLKKMPITSYTFLIGLLALCGVNFTSGYFSKDAIIEAAYLSSTPLFVLMYVAACLTSLYMGRLFWIAFLGKPKSESAKKAHESPMTMTLPLVVLAALSLVAGYYILWPQSWQPAFVPDYQVISSAIHDSDSALFLKILTTAAWLGGLFLSFIFYRPGASKDRLSQSLGGLYTLFENKFYFDEFYNALVKKVQQRFADFLSFLDLVFLSGLVVRGTAGFMGLIGLFSRSLHTGNLHSYVYWFLLGIFIFVIFAFR